MTTAILDPCNVMGIQYFKLITQLFDVNIALLESTSVNTAILEPSTVAIDRVK